MFCWALAVGTGIGVIYGLDIPRFLETGEPKSMATNIAYGSLHRLAWGFALAWMVFACVKGYGGTVHHCTLNDS